MCSHLANSTVLQDGLKKVCSKFKSKVQQQVQNIADKINFEQEVQIGDQFVTFGGKLSYHPSSSGADEIKISATASATKLSDYLSADDLKLDITIDFDGKITMARIAGTAHLLVSDGQDESRNDDGSGAFEINFQDGSFSLQATLQTLPVYLSKSFALTKGTATLTLTNDTLGVEVSANALVTYASGKQPIQMEIKAMYMSEDNSFVLSGSSDRTVPAVLGLKVLTVGNLSFSGELRQRNLYRAALGGTLCVGSDCEAMSQNDNNLVSVLSVVYSRDTKEWLFLAQLNKVDVRRALRAISDSDSSQDSLIAIGESDGSQVPDLLNMQLENGVIVLSNQDALVQEEGFPAMNVKAGLTIAASAHITEASPTVFEVCVPVSDNTVTIAEQPAKFKVAVHSASTDGDFVGGSQILAFGALKSSGKLVYTMKFRESLQLAQAAFEIPMRKSVRKGVSALSRCMDKAPEIFYTIDEDLTGTDNGHFAASGRTTSGEFGATVLMSKEAGVKSFVVAATMTSEFFGKLVSERLGGKNPMAEMALFSNFHVAVVAANQQISLPQGVSLPAPFEDQSIVEKGFCIVGQLGLPSKPCNGPICGLVTKSMGGGRKVAMSGCFSGTETSFKLSLNSVPLSPAASIEEAGIEFTLKPASVEVAGTITVNIDIKGKQYVFKGRVSLEQKGVVTMLGIQGSAIGMFTNVFGLANLNLYDLTIGASVGQVAGVPALTSAVIGGGACFGSKERCRLVQQGNATQGVIAGKLYLGFDAVGSAYFYAEVAGSLTLQDVASSLHKSLKLPDWASQIGIQGYSSGSNAFMSFATVSTQIETLEPPLRIDMGFMVQGRMPLLCNLLGFKIVATSDGFTVACDASNKISLAGGKVLLAEGKSSDHGPSFELSASPSGFGGAINGYANIPGLGEGQINMDLSSTSYSGKMSGVKLFGSELAFDLSVALDIADPSKFELEAELDSPGGISDKLAAILRTKTDQLKARVNNLKSRRQARNEGQNNMCEKAASRLSRRETDCNNAKSAENDAKKRQKSNKKKLRQIACAKVRIASAAKTSACIATEAFEKVYTWLP